jgi:hypothetical protein
MNKILAGLSILALAAGSWACDSGDDDGPMPRHEAAQKICQTAVAAYRATEQPDADWSTVGAAIATIRQVNLDSADPDGLFYQVWQLIDAWDGLQAVLNDPSTAEWANPDVVQASLGNLVRFCQP